MITSTRLRFSISPIPTTVVDRIRQTLVDDFGNHLTVSQSDPAPCRHCLRITQAGERLVVFAYCPFENSGPYAEVGPVFVHADRCESYDDHDRFPKDFRPRVLTMRGYNEDGLIETAELSGRATPRHQSSIYFRTSVCVSYTFETRRGGVTTSGSIAARHSRGHTGKG
jgi:hypothetical protein